jgi:hypothetical protein
MYFVLLSVILTEYTQSGNGRFLMYIHIEKLGQAEECGGARPPPFTLFTTTFEVAKYTQVERADTLPLSHLYFCMYFLVKMVIKPISL